MSVPHAAHALQVVGKSQGPQAAPYIQGNGCCRTQGQKPGERRHRQLAVGKDVQSVHGLEFQPQTGGDDAQRSFLKE